MAASLATTASASAACVAKTTPQSSSYLPLRHRHYYHSHSKLSFRPSLIPTLPIFTKGLQPNWNHSAVVKAQLNEVAVDGSSNTTPTSSSKPEVPATEVKDAKPSSETSPAALSSEESISEFIAQVASLVKLVDSRDIVELQLKQLDCELLIRKKEALPQPPSSAPVVMMQPPPQATAVPPAFQAAPPVAHSAPSAPAPSSAATAPSPPAPKSAKSSLPPLKCPMAGTFYRSPAPGEPPFVKVGDKVQKGQVLCIIEAMKLMNEIENLLESFSKEQLIKLLCHAADNHVDDEPVQNLLESFRKEQLIDLLCYVADNHADITDLIRKVAEDDPAHRKIFVHDLGWDTNFETLTGVFKQYREIDNCEAVADKADQSGTIVEIIAEDTKPVSVDTPLFVIEP